MSFSRINQPTVFETRSKEVIGIFDDFTKSCLKRAYHWDLTKEEAEDLAQESIRRVLDHAKHREVDDHNHCLNRLLNKTCFNVRMDMYRAKRVRNAVKIKEISMRSSAEEIGNGPLANSFYAPEVDQVNVLILNQIKEVMNQVLENSCILDRAIWSLVCEDQMKKKDMANCLGLNPDTFNSRHRNLRLKIKAAITAMNFEYFRYAANDDVHRSAYLINEGVDLHLERVASRKKKKLA
jgi:DNA-directed RNA polymerase specialized sigma24 family protein